MIVPGKPGFVQLKSYSAPAVEVVAGVAAVLSFLPAAALAAAAARAWARCRAGVSGFSGELGAAAALLDGALAGGASSLSWSSSLGRLSSIGSFLRLPPAGSDFFSSARACAAVTVVTGPVEGVVLPLPMTVYPAGTCIWISAVKRSVW